MIHRKNAQLKRMKILRILFLALLIVPAYGLATDGCPDDSFPYGSSCFSCQDGSPPRVLNGRFGCVQSSNSRSFCPPGFFSDGPYLCTKTVRKHCGPTPEFVNTADPDIIQWLELDPDGGDSCLILSEPQIIPRS